MAKHLTPPLLNGKTVHQSARERPVLATVDVLVIGGTSGGVAAAAAASKQDVSVFLVAERTYLGEDICGTYRYWLEGDDVANTDLAKAIFNNPAIPPTPLHVKKTLDDTLLSAGVEFVLGSTPTDIVSGDNGELTGVVITNRSGRQVILARTIIDATHRATIARLSDTAFTTFKPGHHTFQRTVVGGSLESGKRLSHRPMPSEVAGFRLEGTHKNTPTTYPVTEYTLNIELKENNWQALADVEQQARGLTWHEGQAGASEFVYYIPPDCITTSADTSWLFSKKAPITPFQTPNHSNLYVLSGSAGMDRASAATLLRPTLYMCVGDWLGTKVGRRLPKAKNANGLKVVTQPVPGTTIGDCRELSFSSGRPVKEHVGSDACGLPVIGEYDVVVAGGGTGGAPAGIGAARRGAKTLVIEFLHGLGGVGTLGMISRYWYGNITGFTSEVDKGCKAWKLHWGAWDIERKMEWYRTELRKSGADIWYMSSGNGVYMDGNEVKGVIVTTPFGRGVVLCKTVVDSTGNGDLAMAAGAPCRFIGEDVFALQGSGLSPTAPGELYNNTDWTYVDDLNLADRNRAHIVAREKMKSHHDISSLINTRERRSIIGDYTLSPLDVIRQRRFHDTILWGTSNVDSHGYTVHPIFRLSFPARNKALFTNMPYRCLLPAGIEGVLVTGLGASVHRDALPVVRMQADIQNQGYAAGVAAAMAASTNSSPRHIDVKQLQKHLVEIGNLKPMVLKHKDSPLPTPAQIRKSLDAVADNRDEAYIHYATIMSAGAKAIPLLIERYHASEGELKLTFAHCLGLMGDKTGLPVIRKVVHEQAWDKGWTFVGMGNHGSGYSLLDSLMIILGQLGEHNDCEGIHKKMASLTQESEFSHFRSSALALEALKTPESAKELAALLAKDGIKGHAFTTLKSALKRTPPDSRDNSTREKALRELILARALYRCGDYKTIGRTILRRYAKDIRGVFQLHAKQTLASTVEPRP